MRSIVGDVSHWNAAWKQCHGDVHGTWRRERRIESLRRQSYAFLAYFFILARESEKTTASSTIASLSMSGRYRSPQETVAFLQIGYRQAELGQLGVDRSRRMTAHWSSIVDQLTGSRLLEENHYLTTWRVISIGAKKKWRACGRGGRRDIWSAIAATSMARGGAREPSLRSAIVETESGLDRCLLSRHWQPNELKLCSGGVGRSQWIVAYVFVGKRPRLPMLSATAGLPRSSFLSAAAAILQWVVSGAQRASADATSRRDWHLVSLRLPLAHDATSRRVVPKVSRRWLPPSWVCSSWLACQPASQPASEASIIWPAVSLVSCAACRFNLDLSIGESTTQTLQTADHRPTIIRILERSCRSEVQRQTEKRRPSDCCWRVVRDWPRAPRRPERRRQLHEPDMKSGTINWCPRKEIEPRSKLKPGHFYTSPITSTNGWSRSVATVGQQRNLGANYYCRFIPSFRGRPHRRHC